MFWFSRVEEKHCSWSYNVRSASFNTNKDMLHSGQSPYKQSANSNRGKDLRDLQLTCWMFRCIPLLFLLSALCCCSLVFVFWYFSSWGILKSWQYVAVQQMPTLYIPKHHVLLFMFSCSCSGFSRLQHHSLVKPKKQSDQVLSNRGKQQWVLESWLEQDTIQSSFFSKHL